MKPIDQILSNWNNERIVLLKQIDPRIMDELDAAVLASGSIKVPGASASEIDALELRLGVTLPPSYATFLRQSNGLKTSHGFLPANKVNWLKNLELETIKIWSPEEDISVPHSGFKRISGPDLAATLLISEDHDGHMYLLNPKVINENGEWEAWDFSVKHPGVYAFASFQELLDAQVPRDLNFLRKFVENQDKVIEFHKKRGLLK